MELEFSELLALFLKLLLSVFLGAVVGYEREVHERPAGLRTNMLVCMGATLLTLISISLYPRGDPGRIAAQIVSGIGFLGAGTILRQGNIVRGLTTAASLWTVAAIGMAVGMGGIYLALAVVATLIIFATLSVMRRFEPALGKKEQCNISLVIREEHAHVFTEIMQMFVESKVNVLSLSSETTVSGECVYNIRIALPHDVHIENLLSKLSEIENLERFELV